METPHPHAVFWIDIAKISTNPFQPRKYFDEARLQDLSNSIKRYGVLQPIVVTRLEEFTADGGMVARYELIAGERRLRASKLAGLEKIPAIVREHEDSDEEKLELAILENLQREDLNPVDKARSFARLVEEFGLTHAQVGERLGKSREYVSNSMRLLVLPEHMLNALSQGRISEGHTRPLLMLKERPDEQETLFMQLINAAGGMTVREAEKFARSIAKEKQRVDKDLDAEMKEIQQKLSNRLGAKVSIDKQAQGGKVTIQFGNKEDLRLLLEKIKRQEQAEERKAQELNVLERATPVSSAPAEDNQSQYSFNAMNKQTQETVRNESMVKEEWNNPQAASVEPEVAETFTRATIDRNIVHPEPKATSPDAGINSLQAEMERFAAQYQSRTSVSEETTAPKNVPLEQASSHAAESMNLTAEPGPVHEQSQAEYEPQGNNDNRFGFSDPPIQKIKETEPQLTATTNNQIEIKTQFVGDEFAPQQPVISTAQDMSIGNEFVPGGEEEKKNDNGNVNNDPFDLSRFTV